MSLLGQLVEGRYRVDRQIGSGGTADVYAAEHIVLRRPTSLKVFRHDLARPERDGARERRFLGEAEALRRLDHPRIPSVLDAGLVQSGAQPTPYLALTWMPGRALADVLARTRGGPPRGVAEVWAIFAPLAQVMGHAHERGVVHGDLTPSNVLVEERDHVVSFSAVIDFGAARVIDDDGSVGAHAQTRAYAAPEQLTGGRVGAWTDVHALGLLFLELLSNRPPYGAGDPGLAAIDHVRPSAARLGVEAAALGRALDFALALDPSARFPDARAMLAAMREAHDVSTTGGRGMAFTAPSVLPGASPDVPRRSWARRAGPWVAAAAVALAGVGLEAAYMRAPKRPLAELDTGAITKRLERGGYRIVTQESSGRVRSWGLATRDQKSVSVAIQAGGPVACDTDTSTCASRLRDQLLRDYGPARKRGLVVAYASDGAQTLTATASVAIHATAARDVVTDGLGLVVTGVIDGGATPTDEGRSATGLASLGRSELVTHLVRAGLQVTWSGEPAGIVAMAVYTAGDAWGTAYVYDGDVGAIRRSLESEPEPFSWASRGTRLLVLRGQPKAVTAEILGKVVDGLDATARGTFP